MHFASFCGSVIYATETDALYNRDDYIKDLANDFYFLFGGTTNFLATN
jgi:hypothetical protein